MENNIQKIYGAAWTPKYLHFMACILMASMLINQTLALKTIDLMGLSLVASTITYPLSLIICDVLTEVYGFKRTRQLIYAGLALYITCMLLTQLVVALPPSPGYALNDSYVSVFRQMPQIAVAGTLGYLAGEVINSFIMSRLKQKTDGRLFFYRALMSTLLSQIVNCVIFFGVGFYGSMGFETILHSVGVSVALILGYELFCLPFTHRLALYLKRIEGVDYYDETRRFPA